MGPNSQPATHKTDCFHSELLLIYAHVIYNYFVFVFKSFPRFCRLFTFRYHSIHGYLSLSVCILGCIANVANVVVLTRREIRSPTNAILTGLAIADFLVMIEYIPYSWFDYILPNMNYTRKTLFSYSTAWFIMLHSIFSQICHTISIWLTVTLAVWRYIAVAYPHRNRIWCNMRTTLIAIASAYIVCPFAAIPLYLLHEIQASTQILDSNGQIYKANSSNVGSNISGAGSVSSGSGAIQLAPTSSLPAGFQNVTVYKVQFSDFAKNNPSLLTFNLWMYSILIKLIPCFALTILSLRLIGALLEAKRRRKQLMNSNGMQTLVNGKAVEGQPNRRNTKSLEKEKQTDRTTRMLLAVLLLFLITEFPQGILGLLSYVLGQAFYLQCYLKLGKCLCHNLFSSLFMSSYSVFIQLHVVYLCTLYSTHIFRYSTPIVHIIIVNTLVLCSYFYHQMLDK